MRHFKHVGLSAATGLAALLVCSHPASATSSTGPEKNLDLIARQTQFTSLDADGLPGAGQGDEIVVSGDLLRENATVGNYGEVCTTTRTAPADEFDLLCVGSLSLEHGQITFQGRFTNTAAGPGDITLAVTGGTGDYNKARGEIHAVRVNETDTQVSVRLSH
ncbi:allene oxide cyclase barrel-like domain-containing protein [Streptomyces sp. NPDC054841]